MNFKLVFCLLFVYHLTSTTAFRVASFSSEIDFSRYINKPERQLVDDTNVNWIRTNYENAYKCEGSQIKKERELLNLLPRSGNFMITYIYARPSMKDLIGNLESSTQKPMTSNAVLEFSYSQDRDTVLRIYLWRKGDSSKNAQVVFQNDRPTNGIVVGRAQLPNLNGEYKIVFAAKVKPNYQYTFRTYLSQVVIARAIINYV